ncbi:MAG: TIGR00282 family metallophosphoesterase [Pirellulaceae bacterium]
MRVLFLGDIVGRSGVDIVVDAVPSLRRQQSLDLVLVNAENSDGGSGITPGIYKKLLAADVDGITLGDHIYRKKDIMEVLEKSDRMVKPANYPSDAPGKSWAVVKSASGHQVAFTSLMGRVFMKPVDCPFQAATRVLEEIPEDVKIRIVDFHAEATSDKYLMGRYLDGKVSAVLGTHTHVPTADAQIFPGGTGFQCDLGMTGPHESILGRQIENVMQATLSFRPIPFPVAKNDIRMNGVILDIDHRTGQCNRIERFMMTRKEVDGLMDDDDWD